MRAHALKELALSGLWHSSKLISFALAGRGAHVACIPRLRLQQAFARTDLVFGTGPYLHGRVFVRSLRVCVHVCVCVCVCVCACV